MIKLRRRHILFFVTELICFLFVAVAAASFEIWLPVFSLLNRRALVLALICGIGIVYILLRKRLTCSKLIDAAFSLTVYMFLLGLGSYESLFTWLSMSVMWFIILLTFFALSESTNTAGINGVMMFLAILLSFLYIYGLFRQGDKRTVAGVNFVYYVLETIPFLFLVKKPIIKWSSFILVSAAVVYSGKTTCAIAVLCAWAAFAVTYISRHRRQRFIFLCLMILVAAALTVCLTALDAIGLMNIRLSALEDFRNGGNGRLEIFASVLDRYYNSGVLNQIFGHGFFAVDRAINIGSHNDFLMVLYNYGVVGLVLYLLLWFRIIQCFFHICWEDREMKLAYGSSVTIFFFLSMASNILNTQIQMVLLCAFWGLNSHNQSLLKQGYDT